MLSKNKRYFDNNVYVNYIDINNDINKEQNKFIFNKENLLKVYFSLDNLKKNDIIYFEYKYSNMNDILRFKYKTNNLKYDIENNKFIINDEFIKQFIKYQINPSKCIIPLRNYNNNYNLYWGYNEYKKYVNKNTLIEEPALCVDYYYYPGRDKINEDYINEYKFINNNNLLIKCNDILLNNSQIDNELIKKICDENKNDIILYISPILIFKEITEIGCGYGDIPGIFFELNFLIEEIIINDNNILMCNIQNYILTKENKLLNNKLKEYELLNEILQQKIQHINTHNDISDSELSDYELNDSEED